MAEPLNHSQDIKTGDRPDDLRRPDDPNRLNLVDISAIEPKYRSVELRLSSLAGSDFAAPVIKPGDYPHTMTVDGRERQYEMHIPAGYDGKSKLPVIYMLHGLTENMTMMKEYSHMNQVADKGGFAVVYLQALKQPLPGTLGLYDENSWNLDHGTLTPKDKSYDDLDYFKAVKSEAEKLAPLDPSRQFIAGFSEGGQAAQYWAKEMLNTFAGVATIHSTILDRDPRPVRGDATAAMVILGDDDNVLPIKGGHGFGEGGYPLKGYETILIPRVDQSRPLEQAPAWAKANEAAVKKVSEDDEQKVTTYDGGTAPVKEVIRKSSCAILIFDCTGGQHAWDGGNGGWKYAPNDLVNAVSKPVRQADPRYDASSEIWEFFKNVRK